MSDLRLPEDVSKQWEVLLLLLSSEEKKIDCTGSNEVEVMQNFYQNKGIRKIFSEWLTQMNKSYAQKATELSTSLKSNEISLKWRLKGNDCFKSNSIKESYKCYTKSVLYAENEGTYFSLGLANRSASLLRLKKFKQCLADIELAFKHDYPVDLRHKLYLRKADCYIELQQARLARINLDEAQQHALPLKSLYLHTLNEFNRHLKVLQKRLEMLGDVNKDEPDICVPDLLNGENESFVSASQALELSRTKTSGRFVVARESAQRGDVLFKEHPYAFVALPVEDDLAAVCEGCCEGDVNAVPCTICSRAVYCSESCRDEAWETHHQWECVGAQSRLFPTIGIAHLALRVVLISTSRGFPAPPNPHIKGDAQHLFEAYSDCDNIEIYSKDTDAFYRMFNLVTNFDKMNNGDYVQYALTATMLTLYLDLFTSFFKDLPSRLPLPLKEHELHTFIGALILRSMGQLVCNGHATLRLSVSDDDVINSVTQSEVEVRHATAIYPSAAMMNHSCDPNIINTFHKCQLIVRSASQLASGGEVMNCYGPHRSTESTADRRSQLRAQYMFNCHCTACVDTERKNFFSLFSAYSCQSCKGPVTSWLKKRMCCSQCHQEFNFDKAMQIIGSANEIWDQAVNIQNWPLRRDRANAAFKMKQQVLHRHHKDLRKMADHLARIHVELGEYTRSIELIKMNIQSLEYQYGSFSVEVANDLRKLAAVMLERIFNLPQHKDYREWCLETYKILKKAVLLMELNYGPWEPLVTKLKEQETTVGALVASNRSTDKGNCVHKELHYNLKI